MFVSFIFIIFLGIFWLIYLMIPASKRKIILLIASYLFCGYVSVKALAALILSTVVVYAGAIGIENCRRTAEQKEDQKEEDTQKQERLSKWIAVGTILLFAFTLIVVKNIPYAIKMFHIEYFGESHWLRSIVLPVGFSFYAFGAIGYIYDVWLDRETAERDFVSFALYMGFFAKFVSGPIERKGKFLEQVEKLPEINILNRGRLSLALTNLMWGYFLKLVVADRLSMIVNEIYAFPEAYDTVWLLGCAVFYSFQVYTDFAGYTYIAIGCAELFGLELTQNFNSPYWSKNIMEFWRRWHISLSSWLRDYVYIPLGGNRKGVLRRYINTMVVFILCGIWHGNGLSFLAWGLLHGVYSVAERMMSGRKNTGRGKAEAEKSTPCAGLGVPGEEIPANLAVRDEMVRPGAPGKEYPTDFAVRDGMVRPDTSGKEPAKMRGGRLTLSRIITFLAVTFAWLFFRADSLLLALKYIRLLFTNGIHPLMHIPFFEKSGIVMLQVYLSILLILVVQVADGISYRREEPLPVWIQHKKPVVRYFFFYTCIIAIFVFGIYGGDFPTETFIYMQF